MSNKGSAKTLTVYGYYGQNNVGDDYIMASVINSALKSNIRDIYVFLHNTNSENWIFPPNVHFLTLPQNKVLRQIYIAYRAAKSDKFIIGGGGLWPDDSLLKILCNYFHVVCAKIFKTQIALYGVEITTVRNAKTRKIWNRLLGNVEWVVTRTKESLKIIQSLNPCVSAFYSPDVTFAISDEELAKYVIQKGNTDNTIEKFIIWVLAMPWTAAEMEQEHYKSRYKKFLQAILNIQEKTLQIFPNEKNIIIPFLKNSDDRLIEDLLAMGFQNAIVYRPELYDTRKFFSKATFAIDMRFHSVIFSMYESCRFAAISYSPKTTDTLRDNNESCFTEFGIRESAYFYKEFDLDSDGFVSKILQTYCAELDSEKVDALKKDAKKTESMLIEWLNK